MGRKRAYENPGFAKLLDAWIPPSGAGDAVGCLATSYTFSPEFFEEQCLTRFVQMQSDPDADGPAYIVEREEKFSQLRCAAALVDQHHCSGQRSLRWDLLSARLPQGILHAKIVLLHWSNLVRVMVSSANVTEDGYRRNQEVFGVLDYKVDGDAPLACLRSIVDFLRRAAEHSQTSAEVNSPALSRWNQLLDDAMRSARGWGIDADAERRRTVRISTAFTGKGLPTAIATLGAAWPASSPATSISILSPFFDVSPAANKPGVEIWSLLRKRGEPRVRYLTVVEDVSGEDAKLVYAPHTLLQAQPTSPPGATTEFRRIVLEGSRRLHAKAFWMEDDRWVVYMIGSSNFTSAGLGISRAPNLEANLVYVVDADRDAKAYYRMCASFPDSDPLEIDDSVRWKPLSENEEDQAAECVCLPDSFGTASYDRDPKRGGELYLTFPGNPPAGWMLLEDGRSDSFYSESDWKVSGSARQVCLKWTETAPPSGISVKWNESDGSAWWPVNVLSPAVLPPPDELKNLPLEVLIAILSSARPLHRVISDFLRRKKEKSTPSGNGTDLDPHKRVDTSQFLLQRTRRISTALTALKERMERPAATLEASHWRLLGPVGVMAVADAIAKEAQSDGERCFLISEVALELSRARPRTAPGCLPIADVKREIASVVADLQCLTRVDAHDVPENLGRYVASVFEAIGK